MEQQQRQKINQKEAENYDNSDSSGSSEDENEEAEQLNNPYASILYNLPPPSIPLFTFDANKDSKTNQPKDFHLETKKDFDNLKENVSYYIANLESVLDTNFDSSNLDNYTTFHSMFLNDNKQDLNASSLGRSFSNQIPVLDDQKIEEEDQLFDQPTSIQFLLALEKGVTVMNEIERARKETERVKNFLKEKKSIS